MVARTNRITFTTNQNWTAPPGLCHVKLIGCGGGGGGGGGYVGGTSNNVASGGGGGAAAAFSEQLATLIAGNLYVVEIGIGGPGGAATLSGVAGQATNLTGTFIINGVPTISAILFPGATSGSGAFAGGQGALPLPNNRRPFVIGTTAYSSFIDQQPGAGGNGAVPQGTVSVFLVGAKGIGSISGSSGGTGGTLGTSGITSAGGGGGGGGGASSVNFSSDGGAGGNGGNASDAGVAQGGFNGQDGAGFGSGGGGGGGGGGTETGTNGPGGTGGAGKNGILIIEWTE